MAAWPRKAHQRGGDRGQDLAQLGVAALDGLGLDPGVELYGRRDALDRRCRERPLSPPDPYHLPVGAPGQGVDLVRQVARRARDAAEHAHDQAELVRGTQHAHVEDCRVLCTASWRLRSGLKPAKADGAPPRANAPGFPRLKERSL